MLFIDEQINLSIDVNNSNYSNKPYPIFPCLYHIFIKEYNQFI